MKGTIITAIVACVLSLVVPEVALAQESTKGSAHAGPDTSDKLKPWVRIDDGVRVTRVPRPNEKDPEFAILQLSEAKYDQFQKDPREFVNKYRIFKKQVNSLLKFGEEASPKPPQGADPDQYVIIAHWPTSNALYTTATGGTGPPN